MEVKVLLSFLVFGYLLIVEGCNRINECSHGAYCHQRHRRSLEDDANKRPESAEIDNHQSIKLQADLCSFNTYDADLNGEISEEELYAAVGINQETEALFLALNTMKEDGVIKPDEFYAFAPLIIEECFNPDK